MVSSKIKNISITFILTLSLLCIITENIFPQKIIYPNLPSDEITGIHFLNESELLLINRGGSIFKSYDGGYSWELKKHYQGESLESIQFVNSNSGFIIPAKKPNLGTIGIIYTNSAGEKWDVLPLSVSGINDFLPLSESTCLKATWDGTIERLDNFYNVWDTVYSLPKFKLSDSEFGDVNYSYGYISHLEKISTTEIIAVGNNQYAFENNIVKDSLSFILKSTDAGITWDTLLIGLNNKISQITFVNSSIGWFVSGSDIYKTNDGGLTWQNISTNNSFKYASDIHAADESVLYIPTGGAGYWKSVDSGVTWESHSLNLKIQSISKVNFINKDNGFLFGRSLLKSLNNINDLEIIHNPIRDNIWSMSFIDSKVGVASGDDGIYKTVDGGKNWEHKLVNKNFGDWGKVKLLPNSEGWYVSYLNIFKTNDLGETWTEVKLSDKSQLYSGVHFYNNDLGIIYNVAEEIRTNSRIYENKYHYITIDGGKNWETVPIDSNFVQSSFEKMKFTDPEHLFAINMDGLWISRDTAKTWTSIFDGNGYTGGYTFDFYDSLFGVLNISYSESFITNDGGKTWKMFDKPIGNRPSECKILGPDIGNEQRVLECGEDGKLIYYKFDTNGHMVNSRQLVTFTNESLYSIEVSVENNMPNVWIAGSGYTVIFREYEKTFVSAEIDTTPTTFSLSQNYPNPFNPSTIIKYSIPSEEKLSRSAGLPQVTLKVYNILGQEVATLVNKQQKPGNYEVIFDGSSASGGQGLTSGIYFYKLQSGQFVESKKMLLLK